jgi:hypothetical protein
MSGKGMRLGRISFPLQPCLIAEEADGEVRHFLAALSNWSAEEVDENLRKRVEFSQRALSKLVQLFDKLVHRNSRLCDLIAGKTASTPPPPSDEQRPRSSSPNGYSAYAVDCNSKTSVL